MNTAAIDFNTIMGQMTETSQGKEKQNAEHANIAIVSILPALSEPNCRTPDSDILLAVPIDRLYHSGSQTGATWLTKGEIFNSWEEICSREELGRKSYGWKNLSLFIQHMKKLHNEVGLNGKVYSTQEQKLP